MTKTYTPTKTERKSSAKAQKADKNQVPDKPKARYRIRNWAMYNESLKKRGSITLWIDEDVLQAWKPASEAVRHRGGQKQYSDGAIECLLMVKGVYHLAYRQTEGFAGSLSKLLGVELPIPDYSTLNRRAKTLKVKLPTSEKGPIHAVLDSTGLKVYGEGEWKVRQHGYSKRRTWRKLHLGVALASAVQLVAEHLGAVGVRVLDVGAGAAPWSIAVTQHNPSCRVTAVDLPTVIPVTQRAVTAAGVADRYDYLSGDLFSLDLGQTANLAMAGNFCHLFDEATNHNLMARLFDSNQPAPGRSAPSPP